MTCRSLALQRQRSRASRHLGTSTRARSNRVEDRGGTGGQELWSDRGDTPSRSDDHRPSVRRLPRGSRDATGRPCRFVERARRLLCTSGPCPRTSSPCRTPRWRRVHFRNGKPDAELPEALRPPECAPTGDRSGVLLAVDARGGHHTIVPSPAASRDRTRQGSADRSVADEGGGRILERVIGASSNNTCGTPRVRSGALRTRPRQAPRHRGIIRRQTAGCTGRLDTAVIDQS